MSREGFISREQLANKCNVSSKTLKRKMKRLGIIIPSGFISPKDQDHILEKMGITKKKIN